mmetsp:Transcript_9191/g.13031  ORF Transcript_9191/g.13031 Transcript_9191/m.13031 type:complete len:127 (+) Transcript_9191:1007-1387(+)
MEILEGEEADDDIQLETVRPCRNPRRQCIRNNKDNKNKIQMNNNELMHDGEDGDSEVDDFRQNNNNDDNNLDFEDDFFQEEDVQNVNDEVNNMMDAEKEDYEFDKIIEHKWADGLLMLEVQLTSGQ